jgi:hypothetical protein
VRRLSAAASSRWTHFASTCSTTWKTLSSLSSREGLRRAPCSDPGREEPNESTATRGVFIVVLVYACSNSGEMNRTHYRNAPNEGWRLASRRDSSKASQRVSKSPPQKPPYQCERDRARCSVAGCATNRGCPILDRVRVLSVKGGKPGMPIDRVVVSDTCCPTPASFACRLPFFVALQTLPNAKSQPSSQLWQENRLPLESRRPAAFPLTAF